MLDDLAAAHARIDRWESDLSDRVARAGALASRIMHLRGTAQDPDGMVEVTVDSAGVPTDLRLGEAVRHRPAFEIAHLVLATMRAAQAHLSDQVAGEARAVYGADSPAAAAVAARIQARFGSGGDDAAG